MHWWLITVGCLCGALLIQYVCSSKILRMKQAISLKTISLREARDEGGRLQEQQTELENQQRSLGASMERLTKDIHKKWKELEEKGIEPPAPGFPLADHADPEDSDS